MSLGDVSEGERKLEKRKKERTTGRQSVCERERESESEGENEKKREREWERGEIIKRDAQIEKLQSIAKFNTDRSLQAVENQMEWTMDNEMEWQQIVEQLLGESALLEIKWKQIVGQPFHLATITSNFDRSHGGVPKARVLLWAVPCSTWVKISPKKRWSSSSQWSDAECF